MPSLKRTRIDREAEKDGRWFDYTKVPGVRLKIARWQNPDHAEALRRLTDARQAEVRAAAKAQDGAEDRGVLREINARAAAEHLLLDWSGVTEDDAEGAAHVPYTPDEGYDAMMDVELPLYDDVLEIAMNELRFRRQAEEADRGN